MARRRRSSNLSARSTRLVSGHGLHPVSATPAYANPCRSNSIGSYNRSSDCRRLGWSSRRARTRQNRAIITGDVRRFGHVINTDGVFGTHRCISSEPGRPGVMGVHRPFRSDRRNRGVSVVAAPQRIRTGPTMPAQCLDTAYSAADALVGGERWIPVPLPPPVAGRAGTSRHLANDAVAPKAATPALSLPWR